MLEQLPTLISQHPMILQGLAAAALLLLLWRFIKLIRLVIGIVLLAMASAGLLMLSGDGNPQRVLEEWESTARELLPRDTTIPGFPESIHPDDLTPPLELLQKMIDRETEAVTRYLDVPLDQP